MRKRQTYRVACLAGDGVGPELMAEACRAMAEVSRLHGFRIEDVHVSFGTEAVSRWGHSLPAATRSAYLGADAVLVAFDSEPALDEIVAELDLRATVTRIRYGTSGEVRLLAPLNEDAGEWTIERAFAIARSSRARLASVDEDGRWHELVEAAAERHHPVHVDHFTVASAMPALAFEPGRFDVVVTGALFSGALGEIAASIAGDPHVTAYGRLAQNGPGVFTPGHDKSHEVAGQGVADPSSMLLAVATLLGEGLGEHSAAETLATAVTAAAGTGVRTLDRLLRGVAATTRQFTDAVLSELPLAHSNAEFIPESRR